MDVSIIIPNYNGEELLRKNLPKVLDAVGDAEIIVIDDHSNDNSAEVLKNFDVKVFTNERNLGFSSTVNLGVSEAKGDIVVLLNTDVVPEKHFLTPLLAHFKDSNVFAVGCLDKSVENEKVVLRGRGLGKFARGFLVHRRGEVDKTNTLWVSGGSGAFRKSIWNKLGGMDPLYNPFYWEDLDLSYRAIKSGFRVLFEPRSVVEHRHETGTIKTEFSNLKVKIIAYHNQFIFVWKNITDWDKQMQHILWLPYHFIKAFIRGDVYFFIGFILALFRLPSIINSSFKAQKLFVKKDREIIG